VMCLSVPGKVVEIGERFVLEYPEESRKIDVSLVDLEVGDYCIVAGGVIVAKVEKGKAEGFLEVVNGRS